MSKPMTPDEVEKKYRKPDGSIDIPGDVRIVMPPKGDALSAITRAKKEYDSK